VDIALIIHELLVEGGGERQCVCLAMALAGRGHRVTLYTSAYDREKCFSETCKNFTVKEVGRGAFAWLRRPFFVRGFLDMIRLAGAVEEEHEIWNPHHWPAQWGALWLKRKLGGKVVWMCNDVPDFHQKAQAASGFRGAVLVSRYRLYYLYDRKQNCQIDLTLLLSNWAEREYKAIYRGRTQVVRSGADPAHFFPGGNRNKFRTKFGYTDDEFVLLWLGIFMPHRRLEDAIQAVAQLARHGIKVRLLLAGSERSYPRYVESLKDLANNLGVDHEVTFTGKIPDDEIRDLYAACDAFLFPNHQQTWGLAVFEAMACGCPVLVSRGAGAHEVLTDGHNAVLFSPRNPQELATKIEWLVNNPHVKDEISRNGTRLVREVYNWQQFADQIERECQSLLREERSQLSGSFADKFALHREDIS
jgi:glycosyltransferase involved in cell wall biosynthesis